VLDMRDAVQGRQVRERRESAPDRPKHKPNNAKKRRV
jgi:hypothetical protein